MQWLKPIGNCTKFKLNVLNNDIESKCTRFLVSEPLFTDTVVAANAYVFFAGGYETNINTLIYCLYELALNPSIYEKLRNEVDSVKETNGGVLTFEATKELVYLDAVISGKYRVSYLSNMYVY